MQQIKTKMRYHFTPTRMAIIKKTRKRCWRGYREKGSLVLCTVGGNVNGCSHHGKQYGGSLKKLKIEPPYDPAMPLLGIHPKEVKTESRRDICTPMFTASCSQLAKIWKQPKCPLMDEWIKNCGL